MFKTRIHSKLYKLCILVKVLVNMANYLLSVLQPVLEVCWACSLVSVSWALWRSCTLQL